MKTELVTNLKRHATRVIAELKSDRDPILITEHGKPAAYMVDVESFESQQKRMSMLEGIARGEKAIQDGRTLSQTQARKRMRKWLD